MAEPLTPFGNALAGALGGESSYLPLDSTTLHSGHPASDLEMRITIDRRMELRSNLTERLTHDLKLSTGMFSNAVIYPLDTLVSILYLLQKRRDTRFY